MISKYILKPIYQNPDVIYDTKLICKFYDINLRRETALLNTFEIVQKGEVKFPDVVHSFSFSKNVREHFLTVDESLNNWEKPRKIIEFLERMPSVRCPHMPEKRITEPLWELKSLTAITNSQYEEKVIKTKVLNKLFEFADEQLEDIIYRYGSTSVAKTKEEIFNELADWNTGLVMKQPAKFLASLENKDEDIKGMINKAVEGGLITKVNMLYYINGQVIGNSVEECILYFKNHPIEYDNYIVPEVGKLNLEKPKKGRKAKVA
jgi:hypothetical protein